MEKKNDLEERCKRDPESHVRHLPINLHAYRKLPFHYACSRSLVQVYK